MKKPSLLLSLIPVVVLISLLITNIIIFKDEATSGPNQTALLISAFVASMIGIFVQKIKFDDIEKAITHSISSSISAINILIIVGALIGTWILSGTVPAMIYYGLKLISPIVFLPVACIICCITSLATGSSWSTTGTIGIALLGIGNAIGLPSGLVAGAIVSGAYFGDKMSPLSDTTNLAAAMGGTDLFKHIKFMTITTGPAIGIAIILYAVLGFFYSTNTLDPQAINNITNTLNENFNISPWLFFPPAIVLLLIRKKVSALPAISLGVLAGALTAILFQGELIVRIAGADDLKSIYSTLIKVCFGGFELQTTNDTINSLLNRGGMKGMLSTVWLILSAMILGGTLEANHMLATIANSILKLVRGTGSLIGATLASCLFLNATASDQYLAIVVSGKMFKNAYDDFGLEPENLSRALEDSGTVTSPLIPWNSCGAYESGVLGVSTWSYAPYAFFNYLSPLIALFFASMKIGIRLKVDNKINQQG